ncbi:MAG TPA: porin family protein [Puia sp.]|nr:porin family protein [Puia sp.]
MKKLVLILIAGVSFATAHAQIQFGVKAGANLSNFTGNDAQGAKSLAGFNGGVYADIPIVKSFSFSPEILYSGKGAKWDATGFTPAYSIHANYLDIPLLVKYKHSSGFNVETGPQVGFLLSAKAKEQGTSVDDKSAFNSTEFAWDFGIGYDLSSIPVGIEFRYNLGISNVENNSNNSGGGSTSTGTAHNSVFQLGLRYTLFGSKK